MSEGKIRGVLLGHVAPHAYAKGLVASDLCLYVSPVLRGTKLSEQFVELFDNWCDQIPGLIGRGLDLSRVNATTPFMDKLFKDNGYSLTGHSYMKLENRYQ